MGVGTHRKDPEEPAEDVLPLRNPGNRFHVEGMDAKSAATNALAQGECVMSDKTKKRRTAPAVWISTLVQ